MTNCPENHRVNRRENWLNGEHCSGVTQCVACESFVRYDISFNAEPAMEVRYSERVNGEWRSVAHYDDLVWEE